MSDITGIFSGKNELAKFLAIGGLLVIFFSFYHPLEKSREYALSKIEIDYQCKLYALQVDDLQKSYDNALSKMKSINEKIRQGKVYQKEMDKLIDLVDNLKKTVSEKEFAKKSKEYEIEKLDEQLDVAISSTSKYEVYFVISLIIGGLMAVAGFIAWGVSGVSQYKNDKANRGR